MAKKQFHVKKSVATVSNPKNVSIFKKLGVNTAISATHMIAKIIEQASTIENLINSLSLESEHIVLNGILLPHESSLLHQKLKDLNIPEHLIICCIIRNTHMLVPNGDTMLYANDKLLILSEIKNQDDVLHYFAKES